MNSYKNIACIAFGNENIALNSYAYEKKTELDTRVHRKTCVTCCSLSPLN